MKHKTDISIAQGKWKNPENGDKLWTLMIVCPEATSISLQFSDFVVAPNSILYIFNPSHSSLLGGFTAQNNVNLFATDLITDDTVIVELYEKGNQASSHFTISGIVHGFEEINSISTESSLGYGASGPCQVNINCSPEGDLWQDEKKGVAKILLDGFLCTGSLLNNPCKDGKLYFLTANHCINSPSLGLSYDAVNNPAIPVVLHWDYETLECSSNNPPSYKSSSGGVVVANHSYTDFALLQLSEPPNTEIYYNGWSTTTSPIPNGVGIHHPKGDVKKIATHSMTPTFSVFWKILWDQTPNGFSVTEQGSSGSPLFMENGKIIGQLYGGSSINCDDPPSDYGIYGNFGISWDYYSTTKRQLKHWLGACSENVTELNGGYFYHCIPDILVNYPIWNTKGFLSSNSIKGSSIIHNTAQVVFQAQNWIELLPGFIANGEFTAMIAPCNNQVLSNKKERINFSDEIVDNNGIADVYHIYPNPTSEILNIDIFPNNFNSVIIKILDVSGRVVYFNQYECSTQKKVSIITSHFVLGVYMLKITTDGGYQQTSKFIKR